MAVSVSRSLIRPWVACSHGVVSARRFGITPAHDQRDIYYKTLPQLLQQWDKVSANLSKYGYVILNPASTSRKMTLETCRLFGKIQGHSRADKDGIVEILSTSLAKEGKHQISDIALDPHSDGTYLDALAFRGSIVFRVLPPKIVAIQCIKPSPIGGASVLVDGEAILRSVIQHHPHLLSTLFSRSAMSSIGKRLVANYPVFEQSPQGKVIMRHNHQHGEVFIAPHANAAMHLFHHQYVVNPEFTTHVALSQTQILIIDNHRILHGRTKIQGDRLFRRVWVQDEERSFKMMTPEPNKAKYESTDPGADKSCLDEYEKYLPLPLPAMEHLVEKIETGIDIFRKDKDDPKDQKDLKSKNYFTFGKLYAPLTHSVLKRILSPFGP